MPVTAYTPDHPYGPVMEGLTRRQRAFVISLNNTGGANASASAREAGYSDSGTSANVVASHLIHDPKIQAAIVEDQKARIISFAPAARLVVERISATEGHRDQLKAALALMTRAGITVPGDKGVKITVHMSTEEKREKIKQIFRALGQETRQLVPALDADFEEVVPKVGGLEDLT